jgi:hypothetical protein
VELDVLAQLEGIGLAAVAFLPALGDVADEVGRVGGIVGVRLDEQAVERPQWVDHGEGGLAVRVHAGEARGGNDERQLSAANRPLLGGCRQDPEKQRANGQRERMRMSFHEASS